MANNENLIPIPGRLHSVATEGHVAGADEIYDDTLQKDQATINQEVNEALGDGGTVDEKIEAALEDVAFIDDSESSPAVVPGFNPESDTVHVNAQTLSEQQKAQVRNNIGLGDVDAKINEAVASEASQRASAVSGVQASVNAEASRAQAAEADRYTKSETYSKEEVNNLITTPSQEYVSVTATSQTTSVTDVLPETGSADTTYRVGNWDGTQYNDSAFSEYAWNGSAYIKLSTKSQIGEVYDISANHADTKYADLAAALGTNGANIPQSLRKGGMSVKFVQSSDNKYVQYRLMANTWSTTVSNWQGVDDEPTADSQNLAKSNGITKLMSLLIKPITEDFPESSQSAGYMQDDGTVDTSYPDYYHRIYDGVNGKAFYINNRFDGYEGNHHILFLDSSDNVIKVLLKGDKNIIENVLVVPANVNKMVVNYKYTLPTLRIIFQRYLSDIITEIDSDILLLFAVVSNSQTMTYSSQSAGYMQDDGTVDTSHPGYYHRKYSATSQDIIYIKNHFAGNEANHHMLFLDSSNNVVEKKYVGNIADIQKAFIIPSGVASFVVNYYQIKPTINKVLQSIIESQSLAVQIESIEERTFNIEDNIKQQDILSYNTVENGYMQDDGTINTSYDYYYHRDYTVTPYDIIYIENFFSGWTDNHHVLFLDSSDNIIGTKYLGNVNNIKGYLEIPQSTSKMVINTHLDTPPIVTKVVDNYIKSQDLQNQINEISDSWVGKKWVAVGDSLTEFNSRTTKNYAKYIQEKTGITLVNMGVSGTGYKKLEGDNLAFYQRVNDIPTDADIITIFGSFNDMNVPDYSLGTPSDTDNSTICGCINMTLDTILSKYLAAGKVPVIGVITPTPWDGYTPTSTTSRNSLYCDGIIECCKRKSVPVLDLYRCSNLHPENATFRTLAYSHDGGHGVHPDELGHKIIASTVFEFLKKLLMK